MNPIHVQQIRFSLLASTIFNWLTFLILLGTGIAIQVQANKLHYDSTNADTIGWIIGLLATPVIFIHSRSSLSIRKSITPQKLESPFKPPVVLWIVGAAWILIFFALTIPTLVHSIPLERISPFMKGVYFYSLMGMVFNMTPPIGILLLNKTGLTV